MKTEYNKLVKAEAKYASALGSMEEVIVDKVLFEFGIENVRGDGFCICDVEQANLAPLVRCLEVIKSNGELSQSDHESISI